MDFSHYTDDPVQLAIDLVNTRDTVSGADRLEELDGLRTLLSGTAAELGAPAWDLAEHDLAEVREVRERLRRVFATDGDEDAAAVLNELLGEARATPTVSVHGGRPHLHFEPEGATPAAWLASVTAMGLSVVVCDHGSDRLGVCDAHQCADVYVDTSRNRSRRYCSDTCSTRENVAAYRKRRRPRRSGSSER